MNILQILPELNIGGVETGTLDLSKYLVRSGHRAIVVSAGGELVNDLLDCGAVHYQLPVNEKSVFTVLGTISKLRKLINDEKIDIVHARSRVPAWIAYFACRLTNTPFITTCHGYYRKHLFSSVMGWGRRVIVSSNVVARHMLEDFSVPYERIRLIRRGVDLEKFEYISPQTKRQGASFKVGIIGRITPLKGHLYFIKAMAGVLETIPNLKIWIVGEAPASKEAYEDEVRLLVKRLGLSGRTEFLGRQKNIPQILKHLDLVVLATTTQEAFGRVIIEAQASGVPVVATCVGGVSEIIEEEKTGLLVPPADPKAIARAVIRIFHDAELSRRLAEAAYKKVKEQYSVELMTTRTLEVYQDVLESRRALLIKFSSLGDVILSTASIRAIRKKLPKYRLSLLVEEEAKEPLLGCPYIDELLVCDFKNRDKGLRGFLRLARLLKKKDFELAIDLQNNRKSHLLAWLSGALIRCGYNNKKFGFLLNQRIKDERPALDPVSHQFRILKMLDIDLDNPHLELWPTQEDKTFVDALLNLEWLSPTQKLIGINISASKRWNSKVWPMKSIRDLAENLAAQDIRLVLTGTQKDQPQAENLIRSLKMARPINTCGRLGVNQLACLISRCLVYISSDSAPLHIAAAVDTPFIALFGPTDPARHLPPAKNYLVIRKDLPCSPCYKPKCKTGRCMELITPQEVLEAIGKLLEKSNIKNQISKAQTKY